MDHALKGLITDKLSRRLHKQISIETVSPISGGSIHKAAQLVTNGGTYFLKYNTADQYHNFTMEVNGLDALRRTKALKVPDALLVGMNDQYAILLLEFIAPGNQSPEFWTQFGQRLASLHRFHRNPVFGWNFDNFFGRLHQRNTATQEWSDFFREQRIAPLVKQALEQGLLSATHASRFDRLYPRFSELFPEGQPRLIHGDLWSGNFMVGPAGEPVIFDPAVSYSHREADIALTQLFGGYDPQFYSAYNEAWPLEPGWQSRVDLYNLYPLMAHLVLFGTGYLPQVQAVLDRYC